MKLEKVLMEKFKGFDIYYDKEEEMFVADKKKLNIHFDGRSLWDIKGQIKRSKTEEVDKEFIIKSGYFDKEISKIRLLTINKEIKNCEFEILDNTEKDYEIGKIQQDYETPKLYELSEDNLKIFDEVKRLKKEIDKIEEKQKEWVEGLK